MFSKSSICSYYFIILFTIILSSNITDLITLLYNLNHLMNYCCRSIGTCCDRISKLCEECCGGVCDVLKSIFKTPFDIAAFITILVCGYPIVLTILALPQASTPCFSKHKTMLLVETLGNIIHMIFAIYMACVFRQSYNSFEDKLTGEEIEEKNVLDRVKNLFLYDLGVFFYIFIYAFYIYWSIKCSAVIDLIQDHNVTYTVNKKVIICQKDPFLTAMITNTSSNYAFMGYFLLSFLILIIY